MCTATISTKNEMAAKRQIKTGGYIRKGLIQINTDPYQISRKQNKTLSPVSDKPITKCRAFYYFETYILHTIGYISQSVRIFQTHFYKKLGQKLSPEVR